MRLSGRKKVERSTRSTNVSYEYAYDRVDREGNVLGTYYDEGHPTLGRAESALRRHLSTVNESVAAVEIRNVRIVKHKITDVETVVERF